jgi:hypothetical protein
MGFFFRLVNVTRVISFETLNFQIFSFVSLFYYEILLHQIIRYFVGFSQGLIKTKLYGDTHQILLVQRGSKQAK